MAREQWIKDLPHSKMVYPDAVLDRAKYWFWTVYTPLHPVLRSATMALGISAETFNGPMVHEEGRQDYLIGTLRKDRSVRELVDYLITEGYGNHFVAWKDSGEIVSLRKSLDFRYQYHIRVFHDGEIRCHFEYTPEYRPLQHLLQIGFEDRREDFIKLLEGWIDPPLR